MASSRVDIPIERLALELNRTELAAELRLSKAVAQHAILADQLAALDLQLEELVRLEDTYAGQRTQQSMYTAILSDFRAIGDQRQMEQQAIDDRIAAAVVSGVAPPLIPDSASQQINSGNYNDERLTQLEETGLYPEGDLSNNGSTEFCSSGKGVAVPNVADTGSAVADGGGGQPRGALEHYMTALHLDEARRVIDCVVCTDSFLPSQTITLHCGDIWCRGCMSQRYEEATTNEGAWPVKCCRTEIPTESVRNLLSLDLRTRFAVKAVEWADDDRTYCHEPSCATYLPHDSITNRRAPCPACHRQTCTECKGPYHTEPLCPEDTTTDDLLADVARENHWPQCPGCKRYVEISTGCNHMT
jgi:IBR domain, a half RING-finger domain